MTLSSQQIADICGLGKHGQRTVRRWKAGTVRISVRNLLKLTDKESAFEYAVNRFRREMQEIDSNIKVEVER